MTRRLQVTAVLAACLVAVGIGVFGVAPLLQPSSHAAAQSGNSNGTRPITLIAGANDISAASRTTSTDGLIRRYAAAARHNPNDASSFTNLALAYMQKERETSDVTYYRLTDEAAQAALRINPKNYLGVSIQAWAALGRHDFAAAAVAARQAINLNPYDSSGYATLGDAESNLGDYVAMGKAYQRMVNLKPSLAAYDRASYTRWLYGDVRGAVRFMILAIRAGSTERENVAWCETQLGDDYFNAGFTTGARSEYLIALQTFPNYAGALAGMGAVEAASGQMADAFRYYRKAIAVVPLPQYVTALGDLYARTGNREEANRQYALIRFINHTFAINHVRYRVEMAQFYADHNEHLAQALRLALDEAKVRHDVLTMDTLAWALYKNGRYSEAWRAEKQAMRLGTHFSPYYFHAGMIQAKLGNVTEAQSYLHEALMLNPNFSTVYGSVARTELLHLNTLANQRTTKSAKS